jgi:hypothetical protein
LIPEAEAVLIPEAEAVLIPEAVVVGSQTEAEAFHSVLL